MEVLHKLDLALGISDTCREHRCTDTFCTVMESEAPGEQPVPVAYLYNISPPEPA